jgi:hypothetical protein
MGAPLGHELEVFFLVFIAETSRLAAIAPLGDAMGEPGATIRRILAMPQRNGGASPKSTILYGVPGIPRRMSGRHCPLHRDHDTGVPQQGQICGPSSPQKRGTLAKDAESHVCGVSARKASSSSTVISSPNIIPQDKRRTFYVQSIFQLPDLG